MPNGNATSAAATSDACSDLSNCTSEPDDASQRCSAEPSDDASSSDQHRSDSTSENEQCLAKELCLKKSKQGCSGRSESSNDQSHSCSENSTCKSIECCLKSKRNAPESVSSSQYPESNATTSSTDAVSSEKSSSKKTASSKNESNSHVKPGEGAKADENKLEWSLSEDVLLRSMKEASDGLSWEDIGKNLNRGKNECKSRWRIIKDRPSQDKLLENEAKETVEQGTQVSGETKASTTDHDSKTPAPANKTNAIDSAAGFFLRDSLESLTERDHQRQYWREHIGRHIYPASIRVEPDAHFPQSDCLVLEMIDAQYQSMRWQEAQARFYNETGRMVSLEVIRRKCEDAASRTEADIAGWLDSIPQHH